MKIDLHYTEAFKDRHIGPSSAETKEMLSLLNVQSVNELIDQTVPKNIRLIEELKLPEAKTEKKYIDDLRKSFAENKVYQSFIGMGYYNTQMPAVIQRNILENPGWYTAYTPYQAEIAQGRLEALMNFQTMVADLTGMDLSNASLLDEGTAAAEAMYMLSAVQKGAKKKARTFYVSEDVYPQTLDVLKTRADSHNINLVVGKLSEVDFTNEDLYGVYIQNPDNNGAVKDYTDFISKAHENAVLVCMGIDLMSLVFVKSAGEMGADAAIGNSQRFGVPMGYGGPHAAFLATREEYKRQLPGRIIGASLDANGNNAYRMALQTREQHIKRERATSNICTAQVLLGVLAGMYGVYHGPEGLKKIAGRIHALTQKLEKNARDLGYVQANKTYFDTLKFTLPQEAVGTIAQLKELAESKEVNFRYFEDGSFGISLDETTRFETVEFIIEILASVSKKKWINGGSNDEFKLAIPKQLQRKLAFMTHPVFSSYYAEHEMLRYIKRLENKDVSLTHSMISLGSCTMKLNATSEMLPLSWPKVSQLHPYVPFNQAKGYHKMLKELESWLAIITGFAATSLQPNSGAQGEYAGLMVIKAYHQDKGEGHRNVTLIPASAHGTNPASAVMAGSKVIIVASDEKGNIDVADLKAKAEEHKDNLMALMVTYPSTHGVFEESIIDICKIIHKNGGLVYMDGANMNAQVGLTSPGAIGADVCHLNLHKTFAIPHGGGGPGVGPICVTSALAPFLPGNPVIKTGGEKAITSISSAPWGSASVAIISHAYIAMMGGEGLKEATKYAIVNANYIKERLATAYPILYSGANGRCAHEMIVDFRDFKAAGIEVEDVAKRLMDYGFHAPTVSFPVPGTLMIEPTESETKNEMDRFCDALLSIKKEIDEVASGAMDAADNVLKNAPHTAAEITADEWKHGYSRSKAAYPLPYVQGNKFWPAVARVDNAYGDRNLVCSCLPVETYAEAQKTPQG
ncbi:MAG: aminomethyl-transferring glycine dehydrogenase [Cyclobacteriaceae bacterium]|nr:aminomethyl-transferring glycine dehydrogenase [Cyclobacteriaceae bacterium]